MSHGQAIASTARERYKIRPGYLLERILERSKNYVGQLGNTKLIEALENTQIKLTRADRYTALLFAADAAEIAVVRILGEVITRVDKKSKLPEFKYRTEETASCSEVKKEKGISNDKEWRRDTSTTKAKDSQRKKERKQAGLVSVSHGERNRSL